MTHLHKTRAAALITAALLAVSLLFTACPNSAGGGSTSGGSTSGGSTSGPVKIKFGASTIEVLAQDSDGVYRSITANTVVYEGRKLLFNAKNLPAGQQVDKWKVNTKELDYRSYRVDAADAVEEGGVKVITVTYTTK